MKPRILIGLPLYTGWLRIETALFLADCKASPDHDVTIFAVQRRPIDVARNLLVAEARRVKAQVILMVDGDASPAPGTFCALVGQCLAQPCLCGAPFVSRSGAVGLLGQDQGGIPLDQAVKLQGLQPVGASGGHIMCFTTAVFDRLDKPYFYHEYTDDHTAMWDTEDMIIGKRLAQSGVPVYAHFDYWCGHILEQEKLKPEVIPLDQLANFLGLCHI